MFLIHKLFGAAFFIALVYHGGQVDGLPTAGAPVSHDELVSVKLFLNNQPHGDHNVPGHTGLTKVVEGLNVRAVSAVEMPLQQEDITVENDHLLNNLLYNHPGDEGLHAVYTIHQAHYGTVQSWLGERTTLELFYYTKSYDDAILVRMTTNREDRPFTVLFCPSIVTLENISKTFHVKTFSTAHHQHEVFPIRHWPEGSMIPSEHESLKSVVALVDHGHHAIDFEGVYDAEIKHPRQ